MIYRGDRKIAGENIKRLRAVYGVTQEELGKRIKVRRDMIAAWEAGRYFPCEKNLIKLAKFFRTDLKVLMGEKRLGSVKVLYHWSDGVPETSGRFIVYTEKREYMVLGYDADAKQWTEADLAYMDETTGRRIMITRESEEIVLQWSPFPLCDLDIQEQQTK